MAPGYVIALGFEIAGSIGLCLGLILLRTERHARSAELKAFLKSGNAAGAPSTPVSPRRGPVVRAAQSPPRPARSEPEAEPAQPSEALQALRRAYTRSPEPLEA
ncbi:hypothetical protein [Methylobacterium nigriterrae]|uniref:hypothetical protein n=1 Tax=Methylobacterium nigriterrae TaxID=3127512 RepID=UPI003013221F